MNMKHKSLVMLALTALVTVSSCGEGKKKDGEKANLKSAKDSASYAAGLSQAESIIANLKQNGLDTVIDKKVFLKGFADYIEEKPGLNKETSQKTLERYFKGIADKQLEQYKKQNAPKREAAAKFMEENGKRAGISTTESGLQYEVIKKGSGPNVKIGDVIAVHYEGAFTDGNVFESSYERGEPYKFQLAAVGSVIQGWVEALQLMNKGAKYKVYIPYEMAYGEMGQSPAIPPYTNLVFTMEVVSVEAAPAGK